MSRPRIAVALVHHPIRDRRGDLVTTAVTNLDVHDIARCCRTYGVERYYVVTPAAEQQLLVGRMLQHWREGFGASYNPDRKEALSVVEVVESLDGARQHWQEACGRKSATVLTGAGRTAGIGYDECRQLSSDSPLLLVFGTGWGLAEELFERGWPTLAPIEGAGDYNHLPVRSAVAIILDRLIAAGR